MWNFLIILYNEFDGLSKRFLKPHIYPRVKNKTPVFFNCLIPHRYPASSPLGDNNVRCINKQIYNVSERGITKFGFKHILLAKQVDIIKHVNNIMVSKGWNGRYMLKEFLSRLPIIYCTR